jgi:hypothetical protein
MEKLFIITGGNMGNLSPIVSAIPNFIRLSEEIDRASIVISSSLQMDENTELSNAAKNTLVKLCEDISEKLGCLQKKCQEPLKASIAENKPKNIRKSKWGEL